MTANYATNETPLIRHKKKCEISAQIKWLSCDWFECIRSFCFVPYFGGSVFYSVSFCIRSKRTFVYQIGFHPLFYLVCAEWKKKEFASITMYFLCKCHDSWLYLTSNDVHEKWFLFEASDFCLLFAGIDLQQRRPLLWCIEIQSKCWTFHMILSNLVGCVSVIDTHAWYVII